MNNAIVASTNPYTDTKISSVAARTNTGGAHSDVIFFDVGQRGPRRSHGGEAA